MMPHKIRTNPWSVIRLRVSVSDLTWRLSVHRHGLPQNLGKPRPRILLFSLPSLKRVVTMVEDLSRVRVKR